MADDADDGRREVEMVWLNDGDEARGVRGGGGRTTGAGDGGRTDGQLWLAAAVSPTSPPPPPLPSVALSAR